MVFEAETVSPQRHARAVAATERHAFVRALGHKGLRLSTANRYTGRAYRDTTVRAHLAAEAHPLDEDYAESAASTPGVKGEPLSLKAVIIIIIFKGLKADWPVFSWGSIVKHMWPMAWVHHPIRRCRN